MHCASRCTAKSKRIGQPCKSPAVRGWAVCQMHGAGGGARSAIAHPNNLHGTRGSEATFHTHEDCVLSSPFLLRERRRSTSDLDADSSSTRRGPPIVDTVCIAGTPIYSGIPCTAEHIEVPGGSSTHCCCFLKLISLLFMLPPDFGLAKFIVFDCFTPT